MMSLMIMPVQRIPRYQLLARELLKLTHEDHIDYSPLKAALEKITQVGATINESKRDRTTSALTDFEAALNKKRPAPPDLIAILLGTQDSRDPSTQCVPRAVNNLRALITAARKKLGPQCPILLIAPPNLRKSELTLSLAKPAEREACLQSMATAYANLAGETKCAFASSYGVIPEEHFIKGGLLPDEAGHLALAKALLPSLLRGAGFKETVK